MKTKGIISAVLAGMLLAGSLAAPAYAREPLIISPRPTAEVEEEADVYAPIELDGMTKIAVTSSVSEGSLEEVDLTALYDGKSSTYITLDYTGDSYRLFSVYTATRVPEPLSAFAAMFEGEWGTTIKVTAFGTNDSLLREWTNLSLDYTPKEKDGYKGFEIQDEPETYAFYRFDFELLVNDCVTISELVLFEEENDGPEYKYVIRDPDGIDPGEMPLLVPIPGTEKDTHADHFEYGLTYSRRVVRNSFGR